MSIPTHGQSQIGRMLAGQFRIDALLGQGGMGAVYKGTQLSVNRAVAIKLIAASAPNQEELVKRFRREAEATARLSHPNTVRLFDFGVSDAHELYMVMELLEGCDLSVHLQNQGSMPLTEALRLVRQVLCALSEAHTLGIVHRDLKPGNVFLSRVQGGEIFVKVMDFGIAGIEQARDTQKLTMTGAVMGTPAYMSPEQAQGRPVDARSDLYSLGVMLFEMLTGRLPFEADTVVSLLLAHVTKPPARLNEVLPDSPQLAALQGLLDLLLAKTPDERPDSAAAALEAVDALAAGSLSLPPRRATGARVAATANTVGAATPLGWTVTQGTGASAAQKQRALVLLMAAGAVVVGGVIAWRTHPTTPPAPAAVGSLPTPTKDPVAELSSVTIASVPKGASVLLDGAELGKTPYTLQFRHDTVLSVALSGHTPQTITVTKDSDPNLVIELAPLQRRASGNDTALRAEPVRSAQPTPGHVFVPAPPGTASDSTTPASSAANDATPAEAKLARRTEPPARTAASEPSHAEVLAERPPEPQPTAATQRPRSRGLVGTLFNNLFGHSEQRTRREALLNGAPPFPNMAAAQRAYRGGRISADAYEDAVWLLKARREQRIKAEKANLRSGAITPQEYEWRLGRIDAEYRGD
jgi:serine/threonine-protein kinase